MVNKQVEKVSSVPLQASCPHAYLEAD
jgi:hypothetical protein